MSLSVLLADVVPHLLAAAETVTRLPVDAAIETVARLPLDAATAAVADGAIAAVTDAAGAAAANAATASSEAADPASRVGSGRIVGGWGYVWASYGFTAVAVVAYALSLVVRRPRTASKLKEGQP